MQIGVSKYSGETVLRINSLKRDSSWLSAHVRPSSLMSEADKLQKKRSLEKVITEVEASTSHALVLVYVLRCQ